MQRVRDIGEFGLIDRLKKQLGITSWIKDAAVVGIGDDCAVLPAHRHARWMLLTCDPVVEGVHYLPGTSPSLVGWKAMARNLSDIAAMGGSPRWAVVSIGVRPDTPVREVTGFYRGLHRAANRFRCQIVGGDTTHVAHEQFIVVTMIGEVQRRHLALRSGSRPGDVVMVTGSLGGSLRGKHLRFTPRIFEAQWLVSRFPVSAMMDISDGLSSDLHRMIEASGSRIGFDLLTDQIPVAPAARGSLDAALHDGEDFELLLTVPLRVADSLERAWRRRFNIKLTRIGTVKRRAGQVRLLQADGTTQLLRPRGYDHFATS